MKKIISSILSLVLLVGICFSVPVTANAADLDSIYDLQLEYTLADDGYSYVVSGYEIKYTTGDESEISTFNNGVVEIPEKFGALPVTAIGDNAFNGWGFLTSVVLPDNLTEIGYRAFAYCSSLTEITFPKSIKLVDESAFDGCDFLMKLYMPDVETFCNLESMPYATEFMQIYIDGELPEVIEIPETVSTIREAAFANFSSLKKIVVCGNIDFLTIKALADTLFS